MHSGAIPSIIRCGHVIHLVDVHSAFARCLANAARRRRGVLAGGIVRAHNEMVAMEDDGASEPVAKMAVVRLDFLQPQVFPAKQLGDVLCLRVRPPVDIGPSLRRRVYCVGKSHACNQPQGHTKNKRELTATPRMHCGVQTTAPVAAGRLFAPISNASFRHSAVHCMHTGDARRGPWGRPEGGFYPKSFPLFQLQGSPWRSSKKPHEKPSFYYEVYVPQLDPAVKTD